MFDTILVIINDFITLHADVPAEHTPSAITALRAHYRNLHHWETVWVGEAANAPYIHYPTPSGQYMERRHATKQVIKQYIHPRSGHHPLVDPRTPYTY